jgi:uncharacterized protein (TIRG00374 family)
MTRLHKTFLRPGNLVWLFLPLLLYWSLREVPFSDIRQVLGEFSVQDLLILISINIIVLVIFSSRWWLILRSQGYKPPYLSITGYRTAAFAISYFTPGTQFGGEPFQVHLLEKRQSVPGSSAVAAVALDKLFELIANFTFLITGIGFIIYRGVFSGSTSQALILISFFLILPLAYLAFLWFERFPFTTLVKRLLSWKAKNPRLNRFLPIVNSSERQISNLLREKPVTILWIFLASGLIWIVSIAEYGIALNLLGARLSLAQIIIALTAARIAFLTPLPGGVGALEASQVLAMQALGLSPALGISISLLIRGRDLLVGTAGILLGAFFTQQLPGKSFASQTGD